MPSLPDPTPLQFWAGPGRHLLHYAIDGGRTVNFLAVVRVPAWTNEAWMEECAVSDAVDAFAGWHPAVTEMVGATDVGARWALHDLAPLERWHTERVVLMGDAAHAMVPHQGQGANQTIEDAIVLADCLAGDDDPRPRCARYAERRRKRTARVQRWSRRAADLMHLPDGPEIAAARRRVRGPVLRAGLDPFLRRARSGVPADGDARWPASISQEELAAFGRDGCRSRGSRPASAAGGVMTSTTVAPSMPCVMSCRPPPCSARR